MAKTKNITAKTQSSTTEKFYEFRNATETTVDLYFYGDIVSDWWGAWQEEDQYPDSVKNFLQEANGRDLNIYINSGGGSVFAGIAIYNMLKRYSGRIVVHVDALAGSIASVIAFAGSEPPDIPSNAYLMIHKPWCLAEGNATELRKMADALDAIESGIWSIYEENLAEGATIEQIKELMEAETWLNGAEAEKYFRIAVTAENTIAAAVGEYTLRFCQKAPARLTDSAGIADRDQELRKKIIDKTILHMGQ